MSAAYPRADAQPKPRWAKQPSSQTLCCVCNQPATHRVFVQVSWFRGDDEGPFKACKEHKNEAQALLDSRGKARAAIAAATGQAGDQHG